MPTRRTPKRRRRGGPLHHPQRRLTGTRKGKGREGRTPPRLVNHQQGGGGVGVGAR